MQKQNNINLFTLNPISMKTEKIIQLHTAGSSKDLVEQVKAYLASKEQINHIRHFEHPKELTKWLPFSFSPNFFLICEENEKLIEEFCETLDNAQETLVKTLILAENKEENRLLYNCIGIEVILTVNELDRLLLPETINNSKTANVVRLDKSNKEVLRNFITYEKEFARLNGLEQHIVYLLWKLENPSLEIMSASINNQSVRTLENKLQFIRKKFDCSSKDSLYDLIKKNPSRFEQLFEKHGLKKQAANSLKIEYKY